LCNLHGPLCVTEGLSLYLRLHLGHKASHCSLVDRQMSCRNVELNHGL
jgi:hypothetical protein